MNLLPCQKSALALVLAGFVAGTFSTPALAQPAPPGDAPSPSAPAAPTGAAMPRPLNYQPPVYPPEAEKAGLEATVTLQLDIDKTGKVKNVVVIEPAGHGFDESAVEAAKKLEFEPARKADGTPAAARILYRYSFALKKAEPPPDAGSGDKPSAAQASEALRGVVLASGGDVPLAGATVLLSGPSGQNEATVDGDGNFRFDALGPGKYRVIITAPGYDALDVTEEIAAGESIEVKYRLVATSDGLEVVVRGARAPREVTKRTLEQREMLRIPGTNGDALRALQNLPGVARPPAIAGILLVRGSAPQDTQTFLDGTQIPLIYHFGGLSSVVPTEMIERIDFFPGNFSAQYGRVMGGIVDVAVRAPKNDGKYHGMAQADLVDARFIAEGPVPGTKNKVRFIAGARRSYLDATLGLALDAAGAGITQLPVYWDYQLGLEANPTPSSSVRLTFFGADDSIALIADQPPPGEPAISGNAGFHTGFHRIQLRYDNDIDDKNRFSAVAAVGIDQLDFGVGPFFFNLTNYSISGRAEYTRRISKGLTLNTGLDVFTNYADAKYRGPAPPRAGEPSGGPFSTRPLIESEFSGWIVSPAGYVELEIAPTGRAKLVPGVRVDGYNRVDGIDISPRVNGRIDLTSKFPRSTLKGGVGAYTQPPQPQETIPPFGTPGLRSNRAIHYAIGAEQEFSRNIELSVEGFYKQLDRLISQQPAAVGGSTERGNLGKGRIFGAEFLLKYKADANFFGWSPTPSRAASARRSPAPTSSLSPSTRRTSSRRSAVIASAAAGSSARGSASSLATSRRRTSATSSKKAASQIARTPFTTPPSAPTWRSRTAARSASDSPCSTSSTFASIGGSASRAGSSRSTSTSRTSTTARTSRGSITTSTTPRGNT
ncbi:TonB family protein [Polyangium mundeleinium]|uniref:TonB family protein n=1 Tax=Polyangium mundeleinium TaxID=2995306 RepID=A0ABT5EKF5_9BACT|nr:TonB family protein [Polyangium mundeleinium]MDC0742251.1 TonB family protein [Polyangium mundeleinium]